MERIVGSCAAGIPPDCGSSPNCETTAAEATGRKIPFYFVFLSIGKIKITKYDDSGGTFQETGCPLQGIRIRIPVERDLRRSGRRLRLRPERRGAEEQHQALLVGFDGQAPREHRGSRCRHLHASAHVGGFGPCRSVQRSAHRQPRFQEALPRRRPCRGVARQAGREDREGGREGPQALRRVVRRGQVPRNFAPRAGDYRQTRRRAQAFCRCAQRQRPQ